MSASHDLPLAELEQAVARHRDGVASRVLSWPHCRNTRDLGGVPLSGGGHTRRGVLVRSDSLASLNAEGVTAALDYGVGTVIDLRETRILTRYPYPPTLRDAVRYHHCPLLPADFPLPVPISEYGMALRLAAPRLAELTSVIAAERGVCVFHCHSGTGRTGLVALVLLALAGAEPAAILADHVYDVLGPAADTASPVTDTGPDAGSAAAERLAAAAERLDGLGRAGGAARFFRSAGAADDDLEALRRRLVGAPRARLSGTD